jgi:hypothetical protein
MAEDRPDEQAPEPRADLSDPDTESTLDKLNRGALPPDDPLVQLRAAIEALDAIKF